MTIKTPENMTLLILSLAIIAFYAAYSKDTDTLKLIVVAFVALVRS